MNEILNRKKKQEKKLFHRTTLFNILWEPNNCWDALHSILQISAQCFAFFETKNINECWFLLSKSKIMEKCRIMNRFSTTYANMQYNLLCTREGHSNISYLFFPHLKRIISIFGHRYTYEYLNQCSSHHTMYDATTDSNTYTRILLQFSNEIRTSRAEQDEKRKQERKKREFPSVHVWDVKIYLKCIQWLLMKWMSATSILRCSIISSSILVSGDYFIACFIFFVHKIHKTIIYQRTQHIEYIYVCIF